MSLKCKIEGCERDVVHKGRQLCDSHYQKFRYQLLNGKKRIAAKGSGHILPNGYRRISIEGVFVYEHVYIVERALGRKLPKGTQIHHLNGEKADNRPENLVVCPNAIYHRLLHERTKNLHLVF